MTLENSEMCANLKYWGHVKLQTDAVLLCKIIMPFQQHFGLTERGCFSLTAEKCLTLGQYGAKQYTETGERVESTEEEMTLIESEM